MPGAQRTAIAITGNQGAVDATRFENLPGVAEAIRVSKPYKLITLDLRPEKTIVRVGDATIGGSELAIIAGPCAVESHAQAFAVAERVRRSGARFFRGGAFKPRTSPYAFQGLGEEGLKILAEVREAYGLKIVTEALDESGVDITVGKSQLRPTMLIVSGELQQTSHVRRARLHLKNGLAFAACGSFAANATLAAIVRLVTYGLAAASLVVFRRRAATPAGFHLRSASVVVPAAIAFCLWLLSTRTFTQAWILLAMMAVGALLWLASARGSKAEPAG